MPQGRPYYEDFVLERSLMSYKFYHDLAMDMDYSAFAHGPCWEPTISQVGPSLTFCILRHIFRSVSKSSKAAQSEIINNAVDAADGNI